ncbi:hypothetical protein AZI85_11080 [Bdellovibrio bacteriovorus]|uniref:DNA ligase (ATP) n=1 Tax=Bdellovibrio bacteriovorus TaxID=959 RepID=A0A150WCF9_BDEBC|nr:DNA ligase D [Bdellovibrio bacteriovorus]KYG60548.1 hypothetical protein AZI85_11080 [Bdellovibrio bacteriovorus]
MPLREYVKKRDFKITSEPKSTPRRTKKAKDETLMFVVQEHHASHLHYDFRLEFNGVLKSWAVPKGPSHDPKIKRLAVEVEDHPVSYGSFEGVIPEKQYGAGRVYIWDTGTWEPIGSVREGLKKGHLEFKLKGKKLHGQWMLLRTGRPASGNKSQWLLVKRTDEYVIPNDEVVPIEDEKGNVHRSARATSSPLKKKQASPAKRAAKEKKKVKGLPEFIKPMLAELVTDVPEGTRWIHETKFDGYRTQAHFEKGKLKLYTRSGLDWTEKYPGIEKSLKKLSVANAILDGEIVVLDKEGRSDFQKLQNSLKAHEVNSLVFYVFDLLFLDGEDLRDRPLIERKELLKELIEGLNEPLIRYSEHMAGFGKDLFKEACDYQLEGIISKDQDSTYQSRRGSSWVKTKCKLHQEFVIGGYTEGTGARASFGALLLGVYEGDQLRYVGKVGTGFTEKSIEDILKKLSRREQKTSPFDIKSPRERGTHWLKPGLVAEVTFGNWTSDKILRTAVFHGLREDKAAKEIHIEKAKPLKEVLGESSSAKKKTAKKAKVSKRQEVSDEYLRGELSNPDKILYAKEKITKIQVAKFYQDHADLILPHVKDRPLNLLRCPEGTSKQCFFQKHIAGTVPEFITPVSIKEKSGTKAYLTLDSPEGLLALSQMGAFEIHVWGSRREAVEHPDLIVMDFDPGPGTSWKQVVQAVEDLKEILDDLGLKSFLKVSGGKGLHVHIPVAPIYSWDQIKSFSQTLAQEMAHRNPDMYTTTISKKARDKKIFVDYLRNGRGATAVMPYSLRAREKSAVAMPIDWKDLKKIKGPDQFTLEKAIEHLKHRKVDPWKDYFKYNQKISILKPAL